VPGRFPRKTAWGSDLCYCQDKLKVHEAKKVLSNKTILDLDTPKVLAIVQVFRQESGAAGGPSRYLKELVQNNGLNIVSSSIWPPTAETSSKNAVGATLTSSRFPTG
jgi:hypothetical protein